MRQIYPGDRVEYWRGDELLHKGKVIRYGLDAALLIKWDDGSEGEYWQDAGLILEGYLGPK